MPLRRRYIDPATGDYVIENGAARNDDTIASEVVFRFRLRLGSSPLWPDLGSRFHEIRKITSDTPRLVEQHARDAVQDLVDAGLVLDFKPKATIVGPAIQLVASFTDQSGRERSVRFTVGVGGATALAA